MQPRDARANLRPPESPTRLGLADAFCLVRRWTARQGARMVGVKRAADTPAARYLQKSEAEQQRILARREEALAQQALLCDLEGLGRFRAPKFWSNSSLTRV